MSDKVEKSNMSRELLFKIIGMDELSAKILAMVTSKPDLKINQLSSELSLNHETIDQLVRKLASKEIIEITPDQTIRITPNFALTAAKELEIKTERFSDMLRTTRFLIEDKFSGEVQKVFQVNG